VHTFSFDSNSTFYKFGFFVIVKNEEIKDFCYFYKKLEEEGLDVHRVEVYETPNNCAAYQES
jgi:hypothetical protein